MSGQIDEQIAIVVRQAVRAELDVLRDEFTLANTRTNVRQDAIADELRTEVRMLQRNDELLDRRVAQTEDDLKRIRQLTREEITDAVEVAVSRIFSIPKILAVTATLMGIGAGATAIILGVTA